MPFSAIVFKPRPFWFLRRFNLWPCFCFLVVCSLLSFQFAAHREHHTFTPESQKNQTLRMLLIYCCCGCRNLICIKLIFTLVVSGWNSHTQISLTVKTWREKKSLFEKSMQIQTCVSKHVLFLCAKSDAEPQSKIKLCPFM